MDWSLFEPVVSALRSHLYGGAALSLLLVVVNILSRLKTDEEWEALLDSYPRVHAVLMFCRGLGIDPIKVVRAAVQMVTGKAPSTSKSLPPVAGAALLVGLVGSQSGCSWATQNEGSLLNAGEKLAFCVTGELMKGQKDPLVIAKDCGSELTPDLLALIEGTSQKVASYSLEEQSKGYHAGVEEGIKAAASVGVCHEVKKP